MASAQEKVWIAEYLKTFNATEAARRASYKHPEVMGSRKKKKFADEIAQALKEKVMGVDEALMRLSEQARMNYGPYVTYRGGVVFINVDKLKEDGYGHLIREAYTTRDGPRVKLADPDGALKTILDHHTRGATGTEDDPMFIQVVREVRPDGD
ncbi:MAG: terminase small subunit [Chloroflexota bacterium]